MKSLSTQLPKILCNIINLYDKLLKARYNLNCVESAIKGRFSIAN